MSLGEAGHVCADDMLTKSGARLFQACKCIVEHELAGGTLTEVSEPFGGGARVRLRCYIPMADMFRNGGER
jgi:hypothetical protein